MIASLADLEIQPKPGGLRSLKTKAESQSGFKTVEVYVLLLPARHSNSILRFLDNTIPGVRSVDLQHLRRVIKPESLPPCLAERFRVSADPSSNGARPENSASSDEFHITHNQSPEGTMASNFDTRVLLASPTSLITPPDLREMLEKHSSFAGFVPPEIHMTAVPALAPISESQAQEWSKHYWPTMYRNTNPYGPHPSVVARSETEIAPIAGKCLALAEKVAEETSALGLGVPSGCVVISPAANQAQHSRVVAAAGDARWCSPSRRDHGKATPGNVAAHAVMRVIGMIAQKRIEHSRQLSEPGGPETSSSAPAAGDDVDDALIIPPRTPLEVCISTLSEIEPNGYLCTELDIYITHEPCVMCSMAILHSRFKRCIIGSRAPATGGLVADGGLQHGIFWRPSELNWKVLSWEWVNPIEAAQTREDEREGQKIICF